MAAIASSKAWSKSRLRRIGAKNASSRWWERARSLASSPSSITSRGRHRPSPCVTRHSDTSPGKRLRTAPKTIRRPTRISRPSWRHACERPTRPWLPRASCRCGAVLPARCSNSRTISARTRVADAFCSTSGSAGKDLAALAGVARENVSRVLSNLKKRGVIEQRLQSYVLKDIGALEREVRDLCQFHRPAEKRDQNVSDMKKINSIHEQAEQERG